MCKAFAFTRTSYLVTPFPPPPNFALTLAFTRRYDPAATTSRGQPRVKTYKADKDAPYKGHLAVIEDPAAFQAGGIARYLDALKSNTALRRSDFDTIKAALQGTSTPPADRSRRDQDRGRGAGRR